MTDDRKYFVYENKQNGTRFYRSFNKDYNYEDNDNYFIVETNVELATAKQLCKETEEKTITTYLDEIPKELRNPSLDNFLANMIRNGQ